MHFLSGSIQYGLSDQNYYTLARPVCEATFKASRFKALKLKAAMYMLSSVPFVGSYYIDLSEEFLTCFYFGSGMANT